MQVRGRKNVGHGMAGPVGEGGNVAFHNRTRRQASVGQRARPVLYQLQRSGDHSALKHATARVHKRRPRQQAVHKGSCRVSPVKRRV